MSLATRLDARMHILCSLVLLGSPQISQTAVPKIVDPPNLVVLVMDDVGIDQLALYDDLNHYTDPRGYPYADTPNIDALVASGVRFEQFRAQPRCSPFRATALTGRYPLEHGQGELSRLAFRGPDFVEVGVAPAPTFPTIVPIAALLAAYGYDTAAFGKWHLALDPVEGGTMDAHPTSTFGFGEWRGTPRNLANDGAVPGGGHYTYWWVERGVRTTVQGPWVTSYTTDRALDWLNTAEEPFFAWVAYSAAHLPLDGVDWAPSGQHGFGSTPSLGGNTQYRAAVEALDVEIGRLVQSMPTEMRARTLFLLLGDNGTPDYVLQPDPVHDVRYPTIHPLHVPGDDTTIVDVTPYDSGHVKGSVYDTSSLAPLLLFGDPLGRVPGGRVLSPGRSFSGLVDAVDLYATLCELAGLGDTTSLSPHAARFGGVVTDPGFVSTRSWSLIQRFRPNGVSTANRDYDRIGFLRASGGHLWKVVRRLESSVTEFYDLSVDPLETSDLGTLHPEYAVTAAELDALIP